MVNPAPTSFASASRPMRRLKDAAREGLIQADTAVRSAADTMTLGYADEAAAGLEALFSGGVVGYQDRYDANLARDRARDAYDEEYREIARMVGESAATAILAGKGGYEIGKQGSARLSPKDKGKLGEALSVGKSILKGDWPVEFQVRTPLSRRFTVADHRTLREVVEAKFGPWAKLSDAQKRAVNELFNYRVDRWMTEDAGRVLGAISAPSGALIPLMDSETSNHFSP